LLIGDRLPPLFIGTIGPMNTGLWQQLYSITKPGHIAAMRRWLAGYAVARSTSHRSLQQTRDAGISTDRILVW
jgi:hypothetical protein